MVSVDPDFEKHLVTVVFDGSKTKIAVLKKTLEEAGFPIEGEAKIVP